jgi:predicted Fe-Mo cluster-binding NifX family protein
VATLGTMKFLSQFPIHQFKNLTQREYNVILSTYIGTDLSEEFGKEGILPYMISTSEYVNHIHNVSSGYLTEMEIEERLNNYKINDNNHKIQIIEQDVNKLIDYMDCKESQKAKLLYNKLSKFIPDTLQAAFRDLIAYNYISKRSEFPSRNDVNKFIICYRLSINKHLGQWNSQERVSTEEHSSYHMSMYETTPNCLICKRVGHNMEQCFFHPNTRIAMTNRNLKGIPCLLCGSKIHSTESCSSYPDIEPVPKKCFYCRKSGIFLNHPVENCTRK